MHRTARSRRRLLSAGAAALALTLPGGCGGAGSVSGQGSHSPSASSRFAPEPTGGRWQPVVVPAGDVLPGPPPAPGSPELAREIQELRARQARRTAENTAEAAFWNAGASVHWNEIARDLVTKTRTNPPAAARVYAMLSVAQYDALVAVCAGKYRYQRPAPRAFDATLLPPFETGRDPVYPSEHAAVAGASAAVLADLYPAERGFLEGKAREHEQSRLWAGVNFPSDLAAGDGIGREVARRVIERCRLDGSDAVFDGTLPTGAGAWTGTNPLLPLWGKVVPWLMSRGDQFRPPPPPAFGSPEYLAALAEVRRISDTRTPEQLRIARFWADGAGTPTPPGHWNQIASDLIAEHDLNELRAARTLCLLNLAEMDAGISCWDAKYEYFLLRPSQADPAITLPVGLPGFPSYTSGHSTFSGAAAAVLGYLFPDRAEALEAMAQEASVSRIYGGIHYPFDGEQGLEGGRRIGRLATARGQNDGAPPEP